jgi:hypothetical protein
MTSNQPLVPQVHDMDAPPPEYDYQPRGEEGRASELLSPRTEVVLPRHGLSPRDRKFPVNGGPTTR